jgi:hypothetical protein
MPSGPRVIAPLAMPVVNFKSPQPRGARRHPVYFYPHKVSPSFLIPDFTALKQPFGANQKNDPKVKVTDWGDNGYLYIKKGEW